MTRTDPATTKIIDVPDSFYCYNVTAALWADAVINRLEGLAIFLLGDELAEVAGRARAASRREERQWLARVFCQCAEVRCPAARAPAPRCPVPGRI
jgi:hypothetical protein